MTIGLPAGQARQLHRLMTDWDNHVPTWEEFLSAKDRCGVQVTKNCYIPPSLYPKDFQRDIMLFGLLTPGAGVLVAVAGFVYSMAFSASWWWVVAGIAGAAFLFASATRGCVQTAFLAATQDRLFYNIAVSRGAFYFPPDREASRSLGAGALG